MLIKNKNNFLTTELWKNFSLIWVEIAVITKNHTADGLRLEKAPCKEK